MSESFKSPDSSINLEKIQQEAESQSILDKSKLSRLELTYDLSPDSYFFSKARNLGQTLLVEDILWSNKGYNDKYIQWYNKEKWNYLSGITDFESKLLSNEFNLIWPEEDESTLNSKEFASYLMYLKNELSFSIDLLIEKVWTKNMWELIGLWNSEEKTITKSILIDSWFEVIIDEILEPSLLLSLNPQWEKYKNRIDSIPQKELNNICTNIAKWEVDIGTCNNFKAIALEQKSCKGTWTEEIVAAISTFEINNKKNSLLKELTERFNWDKALANQLFESFEESLIESPCTFELYSVIDQFNKNEVIQRNEEIVEENKDLSEWKEQISLIVPLGLVEINKLAPEILEYNGVRIAAVIESTNIKINSTNVSEEDKEKLVVELELAQKRQIQNDRAIINASNLTVEDTKTALDFKKQGKSNLEIITHIRKRNKKLDEAMIAFEQEVNEKAESQKKESKQKNSETIKNSETNNNSFYLENKATLHENWYRLPLESWGYIEWLTKKEAELTKEPETAKNLIEFKNTLDELNLSKLWEYRVDIFKSISWPSNGFSADDFNYLDKNEIKLFLNAIVLSISPELKNNWVNNLPTMNMNLESYKNEFILLNLWWVFSWSQDVNLAWDSYIEKIFVDKFTVRESWKFYHARFIEATKK